MTEGWERDIALKAYEAWMNKKDRCPYSAATGVFASSVQPGCDCVAAALIEVAAGRKRMTQQVLMYRES